MLALALAIAAQAAEPIELSDGASLQLEAGARVVYAAVQNPGFGDAPSDPNGAGQLRVFGRSKLSVGEHLEVVLQLNSATQAGAQPGPRPLDVDLLHLQQGFVTVRDGPVALTVGRQEWKLGNGLLVSDREGPNIKRAFDGGRLVIDTGGVRVENLIGAEVEVHPGIFDDVPSTNSLFWASWWEVDSPVKTTEHTMYYLGTAQTEAVYASGSGQETRHTVGTGWSRQPAPPDRDPIVDFHFDVHGQVGQFSERRILAWGAVGHVGVPTGLPMRLTATLDAGRSSGDSAATPLGTFRAPYPDPRVLGAVTQIAPGNTSGVVPGLNAFPHPRVRVAAKATFLWRTNVNDSIYSIAGFPIRPSDTDARYIGAGAGGSVAWFAVPKKLSVVAFGDWFKPGGVLTGAGPAKSPWLLACAIRLNL